MIDEIQRYKYINIVNRLNIINIKLDDLETKISALNQLNKRSILIDNKGLNQDELDTTKNSTANIKSNINDIIIPSIKNKIYS